MPYYIVSIAVNDGPCNVIGGGYETLAEAVQAATENIAEHQPHDATLTVVLSFIS